MPEAGSGGDAIFWRPCFEKPEEDRRIAS